MKTQRQNGSEKLSSGNKVAPFFSIIIPTLNEQEYLPRLLLALTKQKFTSFEVIIVDAWSKDNTVKEAEKFSDVIPSLSIMQLKKRNIACQRNFGAEKARGKYVVFLDADVNLFADYLQKIHVAIQEKKCSFLTTWGQADTKKRIDTTFVMLYNLVIEIEKAIDKPFSPGFNTIIRRDYFNKVKFWESLTLSEDYDFTSRALKKGITLTILRDPKVVISLRRFRSEGTFSTISRYTFANIYIMLKGPITNNLFEYSTGGHVHNKKKEEIYKKKLMQYLRVMQKIHKSVYDRLSKWE